MDPNVLAVLAVVSGAGGLVAFLRYRSQNRVDDAGATQTLAATANDIYKDSLNALQARVDDMAEQMADLRDRARAAEAAASEAAAEAARFQAELARAIYEAGIARHQAQNEITARDVKIANLEREVKSLREELATLRAQLGHSERRARPRRTTDS